MTDAPKNPPPKYKRSARNYLLDPKFQLKYTGFLVAIALALAVGLGILLWRTSAEVISQSNTTVEQGKQTVKQGEATVQRGQQVIEESRKVTEVVAMQIKGCYSDQPILAEQFDKGSKEDADKLVEQQKLLESDSAFLRTRKDELEKEAQAVRDGQRNLFIGLLTAMVALVVGIGVAGIVFTHKIAGPIFKMKRLMRQVGDGKLVLRERLRKGDELQHFFEVFEQMVETMRDHQKKEIARVDEIVSAFERDPGASDTSSAGFEAAMKKLKTLRHDMQDHLES